jgi:hypothetical protein
MKRFIDDKGIFEIKVPITWKCSLEDGKVHTFHEYEIWKADAFQISIIQVKNENVKNKFIHLTKSLPISKIGEVDYFSYPDHVNDDCTIKSWTRLLNDKIVLFTLTHSNNPDTNLDNKTVDEKLQIVYSIIKEFRLIEESEKVTKMTFYRFNMFVQGVGATRLILDKAIENKAFVEATCILASLIDALLRIGIVLQIQILNSNDKIELEWIYQGLTDKKKPEKDIYRKAKDLGIIDNVIFDKLYKLYDERNKVIHRFIISEITLADVEEIAYNYYTAAEKIRKIIYNIESEQIRLNIGMTRSSNENEKVNLLDYIKSKIGKLNYFE